MDPSKHGLKKRQQFLIDRKNHYYNIPETFSTAPDMEIERQSGHDLYEGTLLDGELVHQRTEGDQPKLIYLIFDCLSLKGNNMMDRAYDTRMRSLEKYFRSQWEAVCSFFTHVPSRPQPFSLHLLLKTVQPVQALEMLLGDNIQSLPFANDGLIFTSKNMPYICGTNQNVLKWKRPEDLTVDFLVRPWLVNVERVVRKRKERVENFGKLYLFVYSGDPGYQYFAPLFVTRSQYDCIEREIRESKSTILECFNDKQTGLWRPKLGPDGTLLFRRDKARANHISVVEDVLRALQETVTEQDLVDFVLETKNTSP